MRATLRRLSLELMCLCFVVECFYFLLFSLYFGLELKVHPTRIPVPLLLRNEKLTETGEEQRRQEHNWKGKGGNEGN